MSDTACKTNVLIVEDEAIVAWDIQEALETLGYDVLARAANGAEAIRLAVTLKPNLVLMDIQLAGSLSGIDVADVLYTRFHIPVVYLTAHTDDRTLEQAALTNPFGYLVKPFQRRKLHTTLQIALRRHQLEKTVHADRQWLTTTLSSMGEATIATDQKGMITFMNPLAEQLTGWQLQEAIGQDINQVVPLISEQEHAAIENPALQAIRLRTRVSVPESYFLRAKDGSELLVSHTAAPIEDPDGETIGSVSMLRLTDSHLVHSELQQRNGDLEQFQLRLISLLQNSSTQLQQAIACTQLINHVFEQSHLRLDTNQILQSTLQELGRALDADYSWISLHDSKYASSSITCEYVSVDRPRERSAIATQLQLQNYPDFYQHLFQRKSWHYPSPEILPTPYQSLLNVGQQILICPIFLDQVSPQSIEKRVIGEVGILTTGKPFLSVAQTNLISYVISYAAGALQHTRLETVSQTLLSNAERLTWLQEDFISSVSHELRNPLDNMKTALEAMKCLNRSLQSVQSESLEDQHFQESLHQTLEDYLQILQEEWQREFNLINDLLSFQTSEPQSPLALNSLELSQWLPQLVERFLPQTSEQRQTLTYQVHPDNLTIETHLSSLDRIVTELLTNAGKFTPPNQRIHLTVEAIAHQVVLKVVNTGIEIPANELKLIFQPFYRLHSNSATSMGTGLGLALVKKLVTRLGGEIQAESRDRTTTLIINLPLLEEGQD